MEAISKYSGRKLNLPTRLAEKLIKAGKLLASENTMPEVKRGRKKKE